MRKAGTVIFAFAGILVLILDTKTAILGALDGMELCMKTVIPSLFPFFVFSSMLTAALSGAGLPILAPVEKMLKIPGGSAAILLIGFLGGYPTGAGVIAQSYHSGQLSKQAARRMLGFCSNAGPSFLFGIIASQFPDQRFAWALWIIHITGALIAAWMLPGIPEPAFHPSKGKALSLPAAVEFAIKIMAKVCGWILFFRIILAFCIRWFLWLFPEAGQVAFMGILELTIGSTRVSTIASSSDAFILCAGLLGFGGICVLMQTVSVVGSLGLGYYLPGKIIQASFSVLAAAVFQFLLGASVSLFFILIPLGVLIGAYFLLNRKIELEISQNMLYNKIIKKRLVVCDAVPQKN